SWVHLHGVPMNAWQRFRRAPGARLGLAILVGFVLLAAAADLLAGGAHTLIPYGPEEQHPGGVTAVLAPPSRAHWLGTDDRGRDVAARLIHGTRVALLVGPFAVALYVALGVVIGLGATLGRATDFVLGRLVEVGLMFPTLLLLLAIQGVTSSTS